MGRIISFKYPQGNLTIEGRKTEICLTAETPNQKVKVFVGDSALVDLLGALKLAFFGLLTRGHTIYGVEGHVAISQSDTKGILQTNIRVGYNGEDSRVSFFLSQIENHRIQWLVEKCAV